MKIPIRAAQNRQNGCMQPAGHQFDMPDLDTQEIQKSKVHRTP